MFIFPIWEVTTFLSAIHKRAGSKQPQDLYFQLWETGDNQYSYIISKYSLYSPGELLWKELLSANHPILLSAWAALTVKSSLKTVNHTNPYLLSTAEQHKSRTKSPGRHTHRKINPDSQSLCFYWYLRCQTCFKSLKTQNHSKLKHIIDTKMLDLGDLTEENQHFSSFGSKQSFSGQAFAAALFATPTLVPLVLWGTWTQVYEEKKQAWKTFRSS